MSDTLAARLHAAISAVCPIVGVRIGNQADKLTWGFTPDGATAPQLQAAQAAIDAFTMTGELRSLLSIIQDLNALTAPQKTAIWTDITSGNPPKWALDVGPNAAAIAWAPDLIGLQGLTAANILTLKIKAVAMYVQDVPGFLVHPAFDPTIFIPGASTGLTARKPTMSGVHPGQFTPKKKAQKKAARKK